VHGLPPLRSGLGPKPRRESRSADGSASVLQDEGFETTAQSQVLQWCFVPLTWLGIVRAKGLEILDQPFPFLCLCVCYLSIEKTSKEKEPFYNGTVEASNNIILCILIVFLQLVAH